MMRIFFPPVLRSLIFKHKLDNNLRCNYQFIFVGCLDYKVEKDDLIYSAAYLGRAIDGDFLGPNIYRGDKRLREKTSRIVYFEYLLLTIWIIFECRNIFLTAITQNKIYENCLSPRGNKSYPGHRNATDPTKTAPNRISIRTICRRFQCEH